MWKFQECNWWDCKTWAHNLQANSSTDFAAQSTVKAHIAYIVFWKHLCPNITYLWDFHPAAEVSIPPQPILLLISCKLYTLSTIATAQHQQGKINLSHNGLPLLRFSLLYFLYSFYSCNSFIYVNPVHVSSWLFLILKSKKRQQSPQVIFYLAPCSQAF